MIHHVFSLLVFFFVSARFDTLFRTWSPKERRKKSSREKQTSLCSASKRGKRGRAFENRRLRVISPGNNSHLIKLSPPNLQLSPLIYVGVVHERDKPRDPCGALFVQVTLIVTIASLLSSLRLLLD